jgi:hypothetical protein
MLSLVSWRLRGEDSALSLDGTAISMMQGRRVDISSLSFFAWFLQPRMYRTNQIMNKSFSGSK